MSIKVIGILGSGSMGSGIAQLAAQSGYKVLLSDVSLEIVEKAINNIDKQLTKLIEKGRITKEEKENVLGRIHKFSDIESLADADFVIEAVIEEEKAKKEAFKKLDQICSPDVVLATNTSSISITSLASVTKRADKVVGMHFFNPAPVLRLVEIIRGYYTSDLTISISMELAKSFGKTPILVKKDSPGFIVNRIMLAQYVEAIRLLEEGVASKEDIDMAVKLGLNYPMGPFELHDFTGTDIAYYALNYLSKEFQDARWNPPLALKTIIRAGRTGRKVGAGWYDY
ncbi:MAG: 3-hydroxyacyl-CoA dehydrogenase family protein [Bacillota bacterium]